MYICSGFFYIYHLEFCILYNNEGTILSMCTGSQIFSTRSSESVFLTTPYIRKYNKI